MRYMSPAIVFLIAGAVCAQPGDAPPVKAPPVKEQAYNYVYLPKVVFVGVKERSVQGATAIRDDGWYAEPTIVVYPQGYGKGVWLSANVSDAQIQATIRGEGVQAAQPRPFQQQSAQPEAPQVDDASIASLIPPRARSYSMTPLYQQMYTMNGGRTRFNIKKSIDADWPSDLRVSGGMMGLNGWRSEKRMLLPKDSKIVVWTQDEDVRALSLVPRVKWAFPDGTVTYDVLSTPKGVYEVRSRTKDGDEWFTKVLHRNAEAVPEGYHGAGRACASCHDKAGGRSATASIYLHGIWGDDTVFSWRPFDESGAWLTDWPLEHR